MEVNNNEELLSNTINSSMDMIQVFKAVRDEHGQIIDFLWILNNKASEKVYGDVIGKSLLTSNPGVVKEGIFDTFKKVVETGESDQSIRHYVHEQFDGWFQQSAVKQGDGVATTTKDITEIKKAEQEHQRSKVLLQDIIDAQNIGIAVYQAVRNAEGQITDFVHEYINRESKAMLGEDWKGRLFTEHGENALLQLPHFLEVMATEESNKYSREADFRGRKVRFAITNTFLDNDRLVHTWEDITAQKKAEQEILQLKDEVAQQAIKKYQTLFESIDDGFVIVELIFDDTGKPVDFIYLENNPAFIKHVGMDLRGKRRSELSLDKTDFLLEKYDYVITTGQPVHFEYSVQRLGGEWFEATAARIGGQGSKQIGVIFRNITERKRYEENLAFLAEVSDDLLQMRRIDEIIALFGGKIGEKFGVASCNFAEMSEDSETVVVTSWNADGTPSVAGVHNLKDIWTDERRARHNRGEITVVNDTQDTLLVHAAGLAAIKVRSYISVPLARDGAFKFLLAISDTEPREWRADEIKLAQELTTRIWMRLERARAEEALRASEQKYRTLFDSIDEGFAIQELVTDEAGNVTDAIYLEVNGAFEQLSGMKDVPGKKASELLPHLEQHWLDGQTQVYKTGKPLRGENYSADLGRWITYHFSRIGGAGSPLIGAVFGDITERKQRERKQEFLLKLSDALRPLADTSEIKLTASRLVGEHFGVNRAFYADADLQGGYWLISKGFAQGSGPLPDMRYEIAKFVPWYFDSFNAGLPLVVHDVETDERFSAAERVRQLAQQTGAGMSVPLVKAGTVVALLVLDSAESRNWTEQEVKLLEDAAERTWAAVELAKAEEALRKSEERLQQALSIQTVGVIFFDLEGTIHDANEAFYQMSGYTKEDFGMGKVRWDTVTPPEFMQTTLTSKEELLTSGKNTPYQKQYIRPDGSRWWGLFAGKRLSESECVEFVLDITEQKQNEQRKNDFISMVSHELKTPLTSTIGYLQVYQKKVAASGDPLSAGLLERAGRQLNKMTTLINGFLNVARLEAGQIHIDQKRFDLAVLMKEVEESVVPEATSHHIVFEPVEETWVNVDKDKIEQVINNLISNAIKYSPPHTTIQIACVTKGNYAHVSIKDEGMGIRPEDQVRLFERFYRVEGQETKSISGFGIGLYLCKEIIDRHKGKIGVQSTVGKGSTFWFDLLVNE